MDTPITKEKVSQSKLTSRERSSPLGVFSRLPLELRVQIYSLALKGYEKNSPAVVLQSEDDPTLTFLPLLYVSYRILNEVTSYVLLVEQSREIEFMSPLDAYQVFSQVSDSGIFSERTNVFKNLNTLLIHPFQSLAIITPDEWDIRNCFMFNQRFDNKLERRIQKLACLWQKVFGVLPNIFTHVHIDVYMWILVMKIQTRRTFSEVPAFKQDEWYASVIDPLVRIANERSNSKVNFTFQPRLMSQAPIPNHATPQNLVPTGKQKLSPIINPMSVESGELQNTLS